MAGPSRKLKSRWLLLAVMVVLLLATIPLVQRYYAVAAVQNALQRNWEIGWVVPGTEPQPRFLPEVLDEAASKLFEKIYGRSPHEDVMLDRFRALFRGPITDIHIYYPEAFSGDLGAALLGFPKLRRVTVYEEGRLPTAENYRLLCARLRELPRLEELEIGGGEIVNASLAHWPVIPPCESSSYPTARSLLRSPRCWPRCRVLSTLRLVKCGMNRSPGDLRNFRLGSVLRCRASR